MTAINVIFQGDAVHVFSDALARHPDGRGFAINKLILLQNLPAVVAVRGVGVLLHLLRGALEGFGDFDELTEGIVDRVRQVTGDYSRIIAQSPFGGDFECVLAGYSNSSGRPGAYLFANHAIPVVGAAAWTLLPIDEHGYLSPGDATLFGRLQNLGLIPSDPGFDVTRDGLAIMELQRQTMAEAPPGSGRLYPLVGGFCQLASVSRDRVDTRVLARWADGSQASIRPDPVDIGEVREMLALRR